MTGDGGTKRSRRSRSSAETSARWVVTPGASDGRLAYMGERGVAVIGWSSTGPLDQFGSRREIRSQLSALYPETESEALDSWAGQLWAFRSSIRVGDEVVVPITRDGEVARGRVVGPYRFEPSAPENHRHQIPVQWSERQPIDELDKALLPSLRLVAEGRASVAAASTAPSAPSATGVSRRAILVGGAAALGVAGVAAALRPWRTGGSGGGSSVASGTRATTTSSPSAVDAAVHSTSQGPVAKWVVDENAKPGTTNWNVTNSGPDGAIEGYASAVSTVRGSPVTLFVSTVDPTFHVEAYRMGWYGGAGGRLIWQSQPVAGGKQAAPVFTPGVNTVEAPWKPSLSVPIDRRFPPGVYLMKIVGSSGVQHLIPLTIRDDASTAAYLVQTSVTTWQAYNTWGGYSLYQGPDGSFANRARIVSFDRPYLAGAGSSDFLGLDFPLIMLMEQMGLDLAYSTDVDTHAHPELLLKHKAFFSHGHDEYWSKEMRDGVEAARDHGVNLIFWGSNAAFRQIRFDSSSLGPNRKQICYKSDDDPIRSTDPQLTTVNWRDAPVARPECSMIGQLYESNPVRADMVLVDPTAWIYNGLGIAEGQRLAGIVGSEYDHYLPSEDVPPNVQLLAHSPLVCRGTPSYANMTYYSAPSGAGVLATGTLDWIPALAPPGIGPAQNATVVAITKNIVAAFGHAKVGAIHPSTPNYDLIAAKYGTAEGAFGN